MKLANTFGLRSNALGLESSTLSVSKFLKWVVRIAAIPGDCKSLALGLHWFESSTTHHFCLHSVAVSTLPSHGGSRGSNPLGDAISKLTNAPLAQR